MKQQTQKQRHDAPEKLDLFRDTFRGKMPLTDDYVFHAVFGRDTVESKGALMEILNIILARKQDPIRAIVIKNPIETPEREMEKGTVMDIKAETDAGELLNIEMQANSFGFYQSRALFYGGRLVNSSLQGGEKYDKMRKRERTGAVFVCLLRIYIFIPIFPGPPAAFWCRKCSPFGGSEKA